MPSGRTEIGNYYRILSTFQTVPGTSSNTKALLATEKAQDQLKRPMWQRKLKFSSSSREFFWSYTTEAGFLSDSSDDFMSDLMPRSNNRNRKETKDAGMAEVSVEEFQLENMHLQDWETVPGDYLYVLLYALYESTNLISFHSEPTSSSLFILSRINLYEEIGWVHSTIPPQFRQHCPE